MIPAWKRLTNKISNKSKNDDFVLEQVYRRLPEDTRLYSEFCYVPGENFQVYILQNALREAHEHALGGLKSSREIAGVLVGRHLIDRYYNVEFVEILDIVRAQTGRSTSVDVDIPASEWGRIQTFVEQSAKYEGNLSIVGWYHSHPRMKAFMSAVDKSTQLSHFNQNGQVAIVLGIGSKTSEVKCFDHLSNEVNLYFCPKENDRKLIKANLNFANRTKSNPFISGATASVKKNIAALDDILNIVFCNYEMENGFNILRDFNDLKGHIQGFDRYYPKLNLCIKYYASFGEEDAIVLRAFENDIMFFAIDVGKLNINTSENIVQDIYFSILDYIRDRDLLFREMYSDVLDKLSDMADQLRH